LLAPGPYRRQRGILRRLKTAAVHEPVPEGAAARMLKEIHRRLKPGAPFVMAHLSFPQAEEERALWLSRYAAFAIASGVEPANARKAASTIGSTLPLLGPEQEEELLREAGFANVRLFYAGMAFRGWVAQA